MYDRRVPFFLVPVESRECGVVVVFRRIAWHASFNDDVLDKTSEPIHLLSAEYFSAPSARRIFGFALRFALSRPGFPVPLHCIREFL